ncbi:hypothetical protein DFH07DRAFT_949908 [Mycena maculata]|uniref:Uncharacterized protein n=1 Tax=Mycena maculata TaxID=230809 RepID=A0AAD7K8W3_9AGAR|nr:hypothetical protein DFH07DRAFT_949908 [Mycena maculata]
MDNHQEHQETRPDTEPQKDGQTTVTPETNRTTDTLVVNPGDVLLGELVPNPDNIPITPAVVVRAKKVVHEQVKWSHKKKDAPKKPGKESWVWGTKLRFFSRYKDTYLVACQHKKADERSKLTGALYTKLAKLYVIKYGYDLADNKDLDVDTEDPPDDAADVMLNEVLPNGEAERRSTYKQVLCGRISQWFRRQYGGLLKEDKAVFAELFTGVLDAAPPKPQQPQILHYYSHKFYESRVKEHFPERFMEAKRCAELDGKDEPKAIAVQNILTQEKWEEELSAFREEVEAARKREYKLAVKNWEATLNDISTQTAEEFDSTLKNATFYLQLFLNAIQERFGMCASLLLAGPIGSRGGVVGIQSVHAGRTWGPVELDWPQFDSAGFAEVEASMIAFAKEHFTEADCRARAVVGSTKGKELRVAPTDPLTNAAPNPSPTSTIPPPGASTSSAPGTSPVLILSPSAPTSPAPSEPTSPAPGTPAPSDPDGEGNEIVPMDEDAAAAAEIEKQINALWKRKDCGEWTPGLVLAEEGWARGRKWGPAWASLVSLFLDFEKVWGFDDAGGKIETKGQPKAVKDWLGRGRRWDQ